MCTQATVTPTSPDITMRPHCAVKISIILSASMSCHVKQMTHVNFYMSVQAEAFVQVTSSGDAEKREVTASNIAMSSQCRALKEGRLTKTKMAIESQCRK